MTRQRRGTMQYDPSIGQPVVRFADGSYSDGLNAGQRLTLVRDGDAIETRLEQYFDENWYYAGTGLHPRPGDIVYLDYSA